MRNMLRALLLALLEPPGIRSAEAAGDNTARLALQEEAKSLPYGAVWDYFCEANGVPVGEAWLGEVKRTQADEAFRRYMEASRAIPSRSSSAPTNTSTAAIVASSTPRRARPVHRAPRS